MGSKVEGTIKCISGRLVDTSHCVSSTGFITEKVAKVVGAFDVEVTGNPTVASLTVSIAAAFGVDQKYVYVSFSTAPGIGGRLLSALRSAPIRALASMVSIQYEVAVTSNMTKTESDVAGAAMALSDPQSTEGQAFSQSMLDSGVVVVSVSLVEAPVSIQSVVVRDETGAVLKPNQPTAVDITPATKDAEIDVGAVIGGVVAGHVLLVLLGGLVQYFILRRKVEDSDEVISTSAV